MEDQKYLLERRTVAMLLVVYWLVLTVTAWWFSDQRAQTDTCSHSREDTGQYRSQGHGRWYSRYHHHHQPVPTTRQPPPSLRATPDPGRTASAPARRGAAGPAAPWSISETLITGGGGRLGRASLHMSPLPRSMVDDGAGLAQVVPILHSIH